MKPIKIDQPTKAPTAKMKAAGAGGSVGIVVLLLLSHYAPDLYATIKQYPGGEGAVVMLLAGVFGYVKREVLNT